MRTYRLQQMEGAYDICLNEIFRAVYGSVYVAFSGKIDHCARSMLKKQARYQSSIANITLHKEVTHVIWQVGKVVQVTGVRQFIKIDDWFRAYADPVNNKV